MSHAAPGIHAAGSLVLLQRLSSEDVCVFEVVPPQVAGSLADTVRVHIFRWGGSPRAALRAGCSQGACMMWEPFVRFL